jgi:predicted CopG family antitoxin
MSKRFKFMIKHFRMVNKVIVTIEKDVYDKLKEEAEKKKVSVGAVIRELLLSYFNLEDNTKAYSKREANNQIITIGDKQYVRVNVKLKKENELIIKNELKKKRTSVNKLLKNEILKNYAIPGL